MSGIRRLAFAACLAATALASEAATSARAASAPAPSAAASAPVEFNGILEAGTTYVGEMAYDARALKIWRPVKEVRVAKNVAWTIAWANIDQFPQLKNPATQARPQRFRFRVIKNDVVSGSSAMPWMSTYQCEILAVESIAAPAAAKAPPKKR